METSNTLCVIAIFLLGYLIGSERAKKENFRRWIVATSYQYLNPGFGTQLGALNQQVPTVDMDRIGKNWNEGSFGELVSLLQDRPMIPAIKNLSV